MRVPEYLIKNVDDENNMVEINKKESFFIAEKYEIFKNTSILFCSCTIII